jgi:hypothetical protein
LLLCRTVATGYGLDYERLMRETPAQTWQAWRTAYDFAPWGEERSDLQSAVLASIVDAHRLKAAPQPFATYMPWYREPKVKQEPDGDPGEARKIWNALAAVWKKVTGKQTVPRKGAKTQT